MGSVKSEESDGCMEREEVEGGENGLVRWREEKEGSHQIGGGKEVVVGGELAKEIEMRR